MYALSCVCVPANITDLGFKVVQYNTQIIVISAVKPGLSVFIQKLCDISGDV